MTKGNRKQRSPKQKIQNNQNSSQTNSTMNFNNTSPSPSVSQPNGSFVIPPPPTSNVQGPRAGSSDIVRQSMEILYGQYCPQQLNTAVGPNMVHHLNTTNNKIPNNSNIPDSGMPVPRRTEQNMQTSQNQYSQQNYQHNCRHSDRLNETQQSLNTNTECSTTPSWAVNMIQNLSQQLQSIQGQREGQNQLWQAIESKIENQNQRMTNMEAQMSQLNSFKQTLTQTTNKVDTLNYDVKSLQTKMNDYERSIQIYSDICDGITSTNNETESQIKFLMDRVNTLEESQSHLETKQSQTEEKLIDIQWRTMRENLIFSGIPESDVRRGEQKDCEELI